MVYGSAEIKSSCHFAYEAKRGFDLNVGLQKDIAIAFRFFHAKNALSKVVVGMLKGSQVETIKA
jgi:hypothetical protein